MPQTRPELTGRPVALFVFSNLREQKGGLTKAWLRRLAIFHEAGWDTHVATIHPQPEIDETLAAWRARGWLPDRTEVHHYQRRTRRLRSAWSRPTDGAWTRDDRIADWLDWLVGRIPGVVVFADSPVTYAPVAKMRNPYIGRIMTVHLAHRGSKRKKRPAKAAASVPDRSIYQGPAGTPKLSGRFLPYAGSADAVVAPTLRQAEHLREDVPGLDVTVIPNILDAVELPDPPVRDPRLVVQLGRLDPFKRIDHAIRAMAIARQDVPDLRLEVYGRGPDLDRLVALRDELGLGDAVAFRGFTDEPLRVLASAAASVMTSRREGFGLAVAESLAVGTPVVSYDIDYGPAELVEDRVNGRIVPNGSVRALAAALVEMLTDPDHLREMSLAGPAAVDRLHAEPVGRQWLELARHVAAEVVLPDADLLVEDLRATRQGLGVHGVVVAGQESASPSSIGIQDVPLRWELRSGGSVRSGGRDIRAQEMTGVLPWSQAAAWPIGSALVAIDAAGHEVPVRAPGVAATVVPMAQELLVVSRDEGGLLRRTQPDQVPELSVQPGRVSARIGKEATPLGSPVQLDARLVAVGGAEAQVALTVRTPGLVLAEDCEIPVLARNAEGRHLVGLARPVAAAGKWSGGRWTTPAHVAWDTPALADLYACGTPAALSMGVRTSRGPIARLDFDLVRPTSLRVGGRWLVTAAATGQAMLIPGLGLRARVSSALSRNRWK